MAILDKITTVAGKAVDKGNDVIEITKLKSKISSAERILYHTSVISLNFISNRGKQAKQ